MDNQHRKISGYRELNQEEIDLMNQIKVIGPELEKLCNQLASTPDIDPQWLYEGKVSLQVGLMLLTRAVAKPSFF